MYPLNQDSPQSCRIFDRDRTLWSNAFKETRTDLNTNKTLAKGCYATVTSSGSFSTRPERLRPKTTTTPEREEPHTTSQTLQQDGDPSSLTTAAPEKPAGSCAGTARGTREETDVKRDEQQLQPANDITNPESRVNDPDCRKTSRTRKPPVRYGWELFTIWNYNIWTINLFE